MGEGEGVWIKMGWDFFTEDGAPYFSPTNCK